jgi:ATP-dependent 26S proteasome regulatory subunit
LFERLVQLGGPWKFQLKPTEETKAKSQISYAACEVQQSTSIHHLLKDTMDAENNIPDVPESQPLLEVHKSPEELRREQGLQDFKRKLIEHREWDAKLKDLRMGIRDLEKAFDKTEEDMRALQSVGMIVGEVLKQLDEEKFIVKASSGPRYVVGCRNKVNKAKLKQGARVG